MNNLLATDLAVAALSAGASLSGGYGQSRHGSHRRRSLYQDNEAVAVTKEGFIVRWSEEKDDFVTTDELFVDLDITTLSEAEQRRLNASIHRLERQAQAEKQALEAAAKERYRLDCLKKGIDPTNGFPLSRQQRRQMARNGIPRK